VTNITFILETSPNTKPKEKKVGGHGTFMSPHLRKWCPPPNYALATTRPTHFKAIHNIQGRVKPKKVKLVALLFSEATITLQALALQPAVWGIACLVLFPSPCNDSSLYLSFSNNSRATAVTHTKSIDRNLLRKETSLMCYTLQSCAKVDIWNKKKKITHCC